MGLTLFGRIALIVCFLFIAGVLFLGISWYLKNNVNESLKVPVETKTYPTEKTYQYDEAKMPPQAKM